jgi:hypothetical protein
MYVSSAAVVKKRGADAKSQIVDAAGDSGVATVCRYLDSSMPNF